jgi:hypothetical protein
LLVVKPAWLFDGAGLAIDRVARSLTQPDGVIVGEMFVHLTAQMSTLGDQGQAAGQ